MYRDQAALDDPSLVMPGGWSHSQAIAAAATSHSSSWMLGDLMRDVVSDADGSAGGSDGGALKQFTLNQEKLKRTWEVSQRSTREDWDDWMKMFNIELLRESPSPSLRSCSQIAQVMLFSLGSSWGTHCHDSLELTDCI